MPPTIALKTLSAQSGVFRANAMAAMIERIVAMTLAAFHRLRPECGTNPPTRRDGFCDPCRVLYNGAGAGLRPDVVDCDVDHPFSRLTGPDLVGQLPPDVEEEPVVELTVAQAVKGLADDAIHRLATDVEAPDYPITMGLISEAPSELEGHVELSTGGIAHV